MKTVRAFFVSVRHFNTSYRLVSFDFQQFRRTGVSQDLLRTLAPRNHGGHRIATQAPGKRPGGHIGSDRHFSSANPLNFFQKCVIPRGLARTAYIRIGEAGARLILPAQESAREWNPG